jgi:translation initiation factor IF-3
MQLISPSMRITEALIVDSSGKNLGKMKVTAAEQLAAQQGLDLVVLNTGPTPICKIMDYGKHKFQQQKNSKKSKPQITEIKELNFTYAIAEHDYQVRKRAVERFMKDKAKVRVAIKLRGREMDHAQIAVDLLNRLYKDTEEVAILEKTPSLDGRNVTMVLAPKT